MIPSRYAYFRDGHLCLLGSPILYRDDPTLVAYNLNEMQKKVISLATNPYLPFVDQGAPTPDEILKHDR